MVEIRFEPERNRAAAYDGALEIGSCTFVPDGIVWVVEHTVVDPAYGGRGIAGRLVDAVVNAARTHNAKIRPVCSYVVRAFGKHPEKYADVLG